MSRAIGREGMASLGARQEGQALDPYADPYGWNRQAWGKRLYRRGLSAKRKKVYERDGYRCVGCGTGENLTLDHIIPRSAGGNGAMENLQTMCAPCNQAKGSKLPKSQQRAA